MASLRNSFGNMIQALGHWIGSRLSFKGPASLPGFSLGISPAMPTEAQSHAAWLAPPTDPKELSAHRAQLKKNLEALECQIKSQQALKCGQVRINELTEEYSVILYMFVHAYPAKERVLNQDRYIERAKKRVADAQRH